MKKNSLILIGLVVLGLIIVSPLSTKKESTTITAYLYGDRDATGSTQIIQSFKNYNAISEIRLDDFDNIDADYNLLVKITTVFDGGNILWTETYSPPEVEAMISNDQLIIPIILNNLDANKYYYFHLEGIGGSDSHKYKYTRGTIREIDGEFWFYHDYGKSWINQKTSDLHMQIIGQGTGPTCEDECEFGTKYCIDDTHYNQCGYFDSDPCLEMNPSPLSCPTGYNCINDRCRSCDNSDLNCDNCISFNELIQYANKWLSNQVTFSDLILTANNWLNRDTTKC